MFVNPDKFQAILLDNQKLDYTCTKLTVGSEEIQVVSTVDLLDVKVDAKLNFNLHIDRICRSASNQLNGLVIFPMSGSNPFETSDIADPRFSF